MVQRPNILHVRLTDLELKRLMDYADFLGYSKSEALRDQIKKLPLIKSKEKANG